jgi:hypothetical protein
VAGVIPRDRYDVVLTDENIESIDFDLRADLVGISAMTCYVNRGYDIADAFRRHADFFGTPERPKDVMRALKGRGIYWQAGVISKLAQDDRMLQLAAESGCSLLSIGFESISRDTLKGVHKHEKVHSYRIMVFGLFMFGFDGDDRSVFQETARFNIDADYDPCAYSVLTPYPGMLTWYETKKADRIVSFDWAKYDQANVVNRPARLSGDDLRLGQNVADETFYAPSSMVRRFPIRGESAPVVHLQSVHEDGFGDRSQGGDRRADRGPRHGTDAAHPPDQAGVAPGGSGGDRSTRTGTTMSRTRGR